MGHDLHCECAQWAEQADALARTWKATADHLAVRVDELEAGVVPVKPWWVTHPDHMKGWEAFGCTGQEPTVRRLGIVTVVKGSVTTEERPGTTPWGPGEVALGVAEVSFVTHADDRSGGYLHVVGTTKEDVEARWRAVDAAVEGWLATCWPRSRVASDG